MKKIMQIVTKCMPLRIRLLCIFELRIKKTKSKYQFYTPLNINSFLHLNFGSLNYIAFLTDKKANR